MNAHCNQPGKADVRTVFLVPDIEAGSENRYLACFRPRPDLGAWASKRGAPRDRWSTGLSRAIEDKSIELRNPK
jgi:hypothetical protein